MKFLFEKIELFNKSIALLGGAILFIAAIITTYDVFLRFIFNEPTSWALEIAQYCLLYATFLGAAYAFKKDLYISVDVITNLLPRFIKTRLIFLGYVVAMLLFLILSWHAGKFTLMCFKKGWTEPTSLQTPMWIPLIIIPIGGIFIALQNLILLIRKGKE